MKSVHFVSLGCPKNLVDSEVMLGLLSRDGFVFVEEAHKAHIIIVNTCAFIDDAKKEAIDTIFEMAQFKKKGCCQMLVVAGCLPQRYEEELKTAMPEVDLFVGVGEFHRIAELINAPGEKIVVKKPNFLYDHTTPRITVTPSHAAYIKIAEGCFHPCSFCVIPKIRGRYRSRQLSSIIQEAQSMLDKGVKEINLIAQDTTAYGRDLAQGETLAMLLRELSGLEGDKWIRLFYAYPHGFPEELVNVIRESADICHYLDIPIQHMSDRILKSMRREGDASEIEALMNRLRANIPGVFIRTSVIVGYPGETETEFEELLDFVAKVKFNHLGAFKYSPEEGSPAAKLKNRIPDKIVNERLDELMRLQREISYDQNRLFVGKIMDVLVEEKPTNSPHHFQGRHAGQAPEIDGVVYIDEGKARAGEFALVRIKDFQTYDLIGDIVTTENVLRRG